MATLDIGSASPLRREAGKLSDRVALELGTRIVQGEIAPGSRLPTEAELGELFAVSRSVIRDAMRMLATRDLVEVRQGLGMVTSRPSDGSFSEALIILLMRSDLSIADVRAARAALETELAPLAAERGTENDWDWLRALLESYSLAVAAADWPAAQDSHLNFHFSLLSATQLPALRMLIAPMQQIILLGSLPPDDADQDPASVWTEDDVRTHHPILEALVARDRAAVRAAMETHFSRLAERDTDSGSSVRFRDSAAAQALLRDLLTG